MVSAAEILAQTSSVSGIIVDPKGKTVDSAVVTAGLATFDPAVRNLHVLTGKGGTFSFAKLPAGTYRLCIQAPGTDLLDPCRWRIPIMVKVDGKTDVSNMRIALEQGVPLKIRIDDAGQLLEKNEGKTKGTHLLVGVWTGSKFFQTAPITGKDNKGRDHTIYVPKDEQVKVSVSSKEFKVAEPAQTAARASTSSGSQVKYTVTGLGSR